MGNGKLQVSIKGLLVAAFVVAILAVFAIQLIRFFSPRGGDDRRFSCVNNLRLIDGAKDQYWVEYGRLPSSTVLTATNVAIYIKDMNKLFCPLLVGTDRTFANSYDINDLASNPTCKVGTNKNHNLAYSGR